MNNIIFKTFFFHLKLKISVWIIGCYNYKNKHNHSLGTAKTLRFLPAGNKIKNVFFEYFNDNMGITEAINCHERTLDLRKKFSMEV